MTVFHPSARVTSPDGREWEIYAYRFKLPVHAAVTPVKAAGAVRRALRWSSDVAVAAVRAVRSDDWTIDAVSYLPSRTVYSWHTTTEFRGQVLAQVEGHLARGDIPLRLTNATYLGEDRRSAR